MGARPRRRSPDGRAGEWAVTLLLLGCLLAVPPVFAVLLSGGSGSPATAEGEGGLAPGADASLAASDRQGRVTFRLHGRTLDMRILRGAPEATDDIHGRRVRLTCGYDTRRGIALKRRVIRWPRRDATMRVRLPARVAAAVEFCGLKRRGDQVARVVFPPSE